MTDYQHIQESVHKMPGNSTFSCGRLGLIGCPIGHSQSPALFREYFADRPDILRHWTYDLIERNTFDEAWTAFLQGYTAVNVTAPFKEDAFRAAGLHAYSALRCMASNLVVKIVPKAPRVIEQTGNGTTHQAESCIILPTGSGIVPQIECGIMMQAENGAEYQSESDIAQLDRKGQFSTESIPPSESTYRIMAYNTDFEAVLGILRQEYPKPAGHKALIIGCGGAGKAAAAAAIEAGMQTAIYNRTLSRPREFAEHLRTYDPHTCSTVPQIIGLDSIGMPITAQPILTQSAVGELLAAIRESDIIIYTIPGPATPILHLLTDDPGILSDKTVIEANYKAPVLAGVPCRSYISGLTWLRIQAIATYRAVLGPSLLTDRAAAKL